MSSPTLFIDIILPLALPKLYTYRVPMELNDAVVVGKRVVVSFKTNKLYTGIIKEIRETPPKDYEAKYIISILDDEPIVTAEQFQLWEWMASYYLCTLGEVMNAALPGGLKLQSETKISLTENYKDHLKIINDKEFLIIDALEISSIITLDEVSKILDQKTVFPIIKGMMDRGLLLIHEELNTKFKPRKQIYVRLSEAYSNKDLLNKELDSLGKKAPKQSELLMAFLKLLYDDKERKEVIRDELIKYADSSSALILQLVKKGILELEEKKVSRLPNSLQDVEDKVDLNEFQVQAFQEINDHFKEKDILLLHGITSSGKTEIYIHLIEETLAKGKQVLYLLPEIALTTQIINRLKKHFGNLVQVYHSRLSENERVEVWRNLLNKTPGKSNENISIILAARSGIFLPYHNLALIIVDEEHENSFKQFDPSPRYHARDSAMVLAKIFDAKTLLGSATPSIESYYNATNNRYGLVNLTKRHGGVMLPEILLVNIAEEKRKKLMKSHFSILLLDEIKIALDKKEQIILFQNRRGFAPILECVTCGWTPHCINCDVSLTYHKSNESLRCHYCGYVGKIPKSCSACGNNEIKMVGFGTEKIEEELGIFFPDAVIARLDLDSTRSKYSYQQIIGDFETNKINVLVGTQMVTKGLDFNNVSIVGILNADSMLNFPDFRSYERSFQLMAQVSGRAGRNQKRGKVIIQCQNPMHPIIQHVLMNDYEKMYSQELAERNKFHFPPYHRLIKLTLKHKDYSLIDSASHHLAQDLKKVLGARVLGPESPIVSRVRNLFLKDILIKIEREASISNAKKIIMDIIINFKDLTDYKGVTIHIDVDPY